MNRRILALLVTIAVPALAASQEADGRQGHGQDRQRARVERRAERQAHSRTDGEACADEMAQYDAEQNEAHAGHSDKICEPSGSQNSCPGYSSNNQVIGLCLQQMWDEGPPPMDPCTGECFQEYGHFINMTSTTVNQVACGFFTTSAGKVWSVQNFSR